MKKRLVIFLLFILTNFIAAQKNWDDPQITAKDIKAHIFYLASDDFKGRFTGSAEERLAGEYIAGQFKSSGLTPLFNGSFFQEFKFIESIQLTENNSAVFTYQNQSRPLKLNSEFITAPFSGEAKINAGLVFAGYGISAPKLNYDDYEGLDVKGKVVIVMRYHPEHDSSKSELDRYATYRQKAAAARDKGAAGIIFVNGFFPQNDQDQLMELHYDGAAGIKDSRLYRSLGTLLMKY